MGQPRLKIDSDHFDAVYHCISKVVAAERLLDAPSREVLRKMLWDVAEFCGIEVLTYILLMNHFHLYILVPKRTPLSDEELLRRYAILHPHPTKYQSQTIDRIREQMATNGAAAVDFRRRMRRQMNDVSMFMKVLKQRFTAWFNDNHDRIGTLWVGRFKSMVDEITPEVNSAVGAYIDLNSVRAGLIADPKDYRFSGYAEAVAGNVKARKGIMFLTGCGNWEAAAVRYRQVIFSMGAKNRGKNAKLTHAQLLAVVREGGKLPLAEFLRCRTRYFTDGLILGSVEFVKAHMGRAGAYLQKPRKARLLPIDCGGVTLAIPKFLRRAVVG